MNSVSSRFTRIEPLEARIAPASVLPTDPNKFVKATPGAPIELHEGELLTTTGVPNSGAYLLFVEKGNALVFTTDLNNNKNVDFNEITGIAAGDGLRIISFVDIHGDIVTNLVEKTVTFAGPSGPVTEFVLSLSDSDSNPANDSKLLDGDGRVLLDKTIEKIELRSLTVDDIPDQNGDNIVDLVDVALRKVESTYSIFGDIYAGAGFGADDGGIIIDPVGLQNFGFEADTRISIGSIRVGTAASGKFFTFGASRLDDVSGTLLPFSPSRGEVGGSINGVRLVNDTLPFTIDGLYAGDGGIAANGGDVKNIFLNGDDTSGYDVVAGNGGRGPTGGRGGSIINFSDRLSDTSKVRIVTGSGGVGTTGNGGKAGDLDFETFNVLGNISMELGNGGNGFKNGGNGASLAAGRFSQPAAGDVIATNIFGTTHLPNGAGGYTPLIGTTEAVDFDLDGFGDLVFTTADPSQLVVAFGDPDPFVQFRTRIGIDGSAELDRIYLHGPHDPEGLVVADLNADGLMDIAVGSMDTGNFGGVFVYLSYFEDVNNDGILTPGEDLNGNGVNDFGGFKEPVRSVLPLLERGDPDTANAILPFWEGPQQITELRAGDFNGDGLPEIAALVTYYAFKQFDPATGQTLALTRPAQTVIYLEPELEMNNLTGNVEYTGQFYADFGTKAESVPDPNGGPPIDIPAQPLAPYFIAGEGGFGFATIEATALSINAQLLSDHDVLVVGNVENFQDGNFLVSVDYFDRTPLPFGLVQQPVLSGIWDLSVVDTNRGGGINLAPFAYQAGTVIDYDVDGFADFIAVSEAPDGYLVGVRGNGSGSGVQTSGNGANNSGNLLSDGPYTPALGGNGVGVKAVDIDGDGNPNEFIVIANGGASFGLFDAYNEGAGQAVDIYFSADGFINSVNLAFDFHHNTSSTNPSLPFFMAGEYVPRAGNLLSIFLPLPDAIPIPIPPNKLVPMVERGFLLKAGDGGDSLIGSGGRGGFIGGGSDVSTTFDPITGLPIMDFVGSVELIKSGGIRLLAGIGGDGFSAGGLGGAITGVSLRLDPNFGNISGSLRGGDGGRGVTGAGGHGGEVSDNSIFGGVRFFAGNGGPGVFGGNGGDVIGNKTISYDTYLLAATTIPAPLSPTTPISVIAGNGGSGTKRGGSGGNILDFQPKINLSTDDGDLSYVAGDGGDSVAGPGGAGGSIRRSSPDVNAFIEGDIYLEAGDGGDGTRGGQGGSVDTFQLLLAALSNSASIVTVIAGNGGFASKGNGGFGGDITGIDVSSRAVARFGIPVLTLHTFNRMIAGAGGGSAKMRGGDGGDITNIRTSADQGGYAFIGGAGGDGLRLGGAGGNLDNLDVAFGASTTSKGLFIAGEGGDATAFVANPNDSAPNQNQNAFGGKVGRGGNGGNINAVTQRGNIGIHVDLIAGNGGDTVNYGTVADNKTFVGRGGSITNVNTAGDIGNIANNVAIKGYNDVLNGESVADFVALKFRDPLAPGGVTLGDGDGNVGIVVGSAGRNKAVVFDPAGNPFFYETQPASGGKNGSLTNLTTRNLMSAVAGHVDRLASIQATVALKVLAGEIGSDKSVIGTREYLDKNGVLTATQAPVRDGRLVDGAVMTKSYTDATGKPLPPPPGVFII